MEDEYKIDKLPIGYNTSNCSAALPLTGDIYGCLFKGECPGRSRNSHNTEGKPKFCLLRINLDELCNKAKLEGKILTH